jgi:dTDP-4-amino-4,6-dideoxygalactose transaminase
MKGFPVSEAWMKNSVSLPIYPAMTDAQARRVVRAVRAVLIHKGGNL